MNKGKEKKIKMIKTKTQKGITLIALIITIVVLLILAAVAINAITEYNIIENANSAAQKYGNQAEKEDETLGGYSSEIDKYMGGTTGGTGSGESSGDNTGNVSGPVIPTTETYVGCYADVDGDGDVDGIIYANLAVDGSGQWSDGDGAYSYEAKATLNNYTVRDATEDEQGLFKDAIAKVIVPTGNRVEANDRFYVMALADVNPGTYYCWYAGAYGNMNDYETATSENFGTGKANTATMIGKWNAGLYGSKNTRDYADMWGVIQEEVNNGWFVPSRAEWAAFGDAFSIIRKNYFEYGLSHSYWSSSQGDTSNAWRADFNGSYVGNSNVYSHNYVRLGTTF